MTMPLSDAERVQRAIDSVVEVWRDPASALEYHTPDVVLWDSGERTANGLESMTGFVGMFKRRFDDVVMEIDQAYAAEGERVVLEWTLRGTQADTFFGVPSQGRRIAWVGMMLIRFDGDLVVERQDVHDFAGAVRQMKGEAEPPR